MSSVPPTLPDLRRLEVDVCTADGTYAAGTTVVVLGGVGRHAVGARRVRVCLDPPGCHLSRCRQVWLPTTAVTPRSLVRRAA